MKQIDINCDLGEGGQVDAQLMPLISSCNIACGGHVGDKVSMAKTIALALKHEVCIGAHPSYEDKTNFGRISIAISLENLKQSIKQQILTLKELTERAGGSLHHVKPHGALYNDCVHDERKAKCIIETVAEIDDSLILFVPPKSAIQKLAQEKLTTWTEGFADRNYTEQFTLVSRQNSNAILKEKERVFQHVFLMISEGKIQTEKGTFLNANFDTICVHSDTQNSIEILRYLTEKLHEKNIQLR